MKLKLFSILICCLLIASSGFSMAKMEENTQKNMEQKETQIFFTIKITSPEPGNFYAMGAQLFPLPFNWTVIIGPLVIQTTVTGIDGFVVDFYINGDKKFSDDSPPFEYPWWEMGFGKYTLEVKLYSEETLRDTDTMQVFKIF